MTEYRCTYCLEVIEAEDYPDTCPSCKVGYCTECHARLKVGHRWCTGCGILSPVIKSRMVRCSSFAACYQESNWVENGLPAGQTYTYVIMHGWKSEEDQATVKPRTWLARQENRGGEYEDVRQLTEDEEILLGWRKSPSG